MRELTFSYKNTSLISPENLQSLLTQLRPEMARMRDATMRGYQTEYASINAPSDTQAIEQIKHVIVQKKALNPTMLIIIGIGGSNMGTMAVHEAIRGVLYNIHAPLTVYYADTVDTDYLYTIAQQMEQHVRANGVVILNVISKSGTTTETITNFYVLCAVLKKYIPDYHRYIVATTDRNSALWQVAQQEQYTCLEIPVAVGGRYSLCTAVSLFPLGLMGIAIDELCAGAASMVPICLQADDRNSAAVSAAVMVHAYQQGKIIHDHFLFSVSLRNLGNWYRQLLAESIGKEYNRAGERVRVGITPTVSIGSTDLHSVGQLAFAGPHNTITTFVSVAQPYHPLLTPAIPPTLVNNISDIPVDTIMQAIIAGTQRAYGQAHMPYMNVTLPEKSAWYLGQYMQLCMMQIMYVGYLLQVNPFDQPNVEQYKNQTRKILSHE